jgi:thiamine-monophosphate kinase
VDLSDGLADGLRHIGEASGVGVVIEAAALPVSPGARQVFDLHGRDPIAAAIAGSDDYELLFTVPRKRRRAFASLARLLKGVQVTPIGQVVAEPGIRLKQNGQENELPAGFAHF